jgi:hypothetical protein
LRRDHYNLQKVSFFLTLLSDAVIYITMEPPNKPVKDAPAHQDGNGQKSIEVTPIQLLGIILKAALKDRVTDEEVKTICSVYYKTVEDWWGEPE